MSTLPAIHTALCGLGSRLAHGVGGSFVTGSWAPLIVQLVKNPPAMPETPVQFLGPEDPMEKGQATHSSILGWRIPWTV